MWVTKVKVTVKIMQWYVILSKSLDQIISLLIIKKQLVTSNTNNRLIDFLFIFYYYLNKLNLTS